MKKTILFFCLLAFFSANDCRAQFISGMLDVDHGTEYDRLINQLNEQKEVYKKNRVKKVNYIDPDTHEEGFYFLDENGLVYKIVKKTAVVDISYQGDQMSTIRILDTFYNQDYTFRINYKKGIIQKILVAQRRLHYEIDFSYKNSGTSKEKQIYYIDSTGKKNRRLKVVTSVFNNIKTVEGYFRRKLFKYYFIDSIPVLTENYETYIGDSIETISYSKTNVIRKSNGQYVQSCVRYSSLYPEATVEVICFDENKLPVKTYFFRDGVNGVFFKPDIIINKFENELLRSELFKTWGADGADKERGISPFEYNYEFYETK